MFLALGIQDTMRVRHIVICVLSGSTIFFHIISRDFRKKMLLNIQRAFWFSLQLLSETFLILRTEPDMIKNVYWSTRKAPFFWSDFNESWNFLDSFSKNTQISDFTKICLVEAQFFQADGHDKADSRFSQFCKRA